MPESCFAMVDCNNFYASCETVFRPDLRGRPLVVLSNNDGCIVSRSEQAKALGIKMAVPMYKNQQLLRRYNVVIRSSNYALYADISERVMATLGQMAPEIEAYSIDEAFLDIAGLDVDLAVYGQQLKQQVAQWVGMPVCVGIAPSKTLAKLANHAAKKYQRTYVVVNLMNRSRQEKLLAITPVIDIWGVGRRLSRRLNSQGIVTALDLCNAPIKQLRKQYSVLLEQTISELRGVSCIDLERSPVAKREIISSRSFGGKVQDIEEMKTAIANRAVLAGEKLRREKKLASSISIFMQTNRFASERQQYNKAATIEFFNPTANTIDLLHAASRLVDGLWRQGCQYHKAGVMLHGLCRVEQAQYDLFDSVQSKKNERLMSVVDRVNDATQGKLVYASSMVDRNKTNWVMRRHHLSPAYTTNWNDLPVALSD